MRCRNWKYSGFKGDIPQITRRTEYLLILPMLLNWQRDQEYRTLRIESVHVIGSASRFLQQKGRYPLGWNAKWKAGCEYPDDWVMFFDNNIFFNFMCTQARERQVAQFPLFRNHTAYHKRKSRSKMQWNCPVVMFLSCFKNIVGRFGGVQKQACETGGYCLCTQNQIDWPRWQNGVRHRAHVYLYE